MNDYAKLPRRFHLFVAFNAEVVDLLQRESLPVKELVELRAGHDHIRRVLMLEKFMYIKGDK